jgi:hypothetical protein
LCADGLTVASHLGNIFLLLLAVINILQGVICVVISTPAAAAAAVIFVWRTYCVYKFCFILLDTFSKLHIVTVFVILDIQAVFLYNV